jgi:acetylornithine deacetylase/succinyl-diaminopimelate desuccinylase-like protein
MQKLFQFLGLKSISTVALTEKQFSSKSTKDHKNDSRGTCLATAEWLETYLRENGFQHCGLLWPQDVDNSLPAVYGQLSAQGTAKELDPQKPTLLFYGHYDVQPAPLEQGWRSEPFKALVKDGKIYARGVADDKGQLMAFVDGVIAAVESSRESKLELNYNIIILIEGEEEIGSPHMAELLSTYSEKLSADVAMVFDSDMQPETPQILLGLRGMLGVTIKVKNADNDLHSGMYGGAVANPARELSKLLAGIVDDRGNVLLPGFYNEIDDLNSEDLKEIDELNAIDLKAQTGAAAIISNEKYSPQQQMTVRPTFELNSIHSGASAGQFSTIIPSEAEANVSFRLVPRQNADSIWQSLVEYVQTTISDGFEIKISKQGYHPPVRFERDNQYFSEVARIANKIWKNDTVFNYSGGSIGVVAEIKDILGIDTILFGLSFPDANIHGANENLPIEQYEKGIEFTSRFLTE